MLYVSEGHATLCLADAKLLFANAYLPHVRWIAIRKNGANKIFELINWIILKKKRVFDFHHKDIWFQEESKGRN